MNLSATIAKMRAAGMTSEAILLALECIVPMQPVVVADEQAERRREADRVRKAAQRACPQTSADIPQNSADTKERVSHTLPKEKLNISTREKKFPLPDDWEPDGKTWKLADELGFTSQEAWDQLERMRDWAKNADGGKGRKSDWNAAFRNWLKRAKDDRKSSPKATQQHNSNQRSIDILDAMVDRAIASATGYGEEGSEEDFGKLPGLRKSAA